MTWHKEIIYCTVVNYLIYSYNRVFYGNLNEQLTGFFRQYFSCHHSGHTCYQRETVAILNFCCTFLLDGSDIYLTMFLAVRRWVPRGGSPSPLSVTTPCSSSVCPQWEFCLPSCGMASERRTSSVLVIPRLPSAPSPWRSQDLTTGTPGLILFHNCLNLNGYWTENSKQVSWSLVACLVWILVWTIKAVLGSPGPLLTPAPERVSWGCWRRAARGKWRTRIGASQQSRGAKEGKYDWIKLT